MKDLCLHSRLANSDEGRQGGQGGQFRTFRHFLGVPVHLLGHLVRDGDLLDWGCLLWKQAWDHQVLLLWRHLKKRCRSHLKKIVQGVLCGSLFSTYSAESVFHIPGGIDPLGGSQRDAEEVFFKRYSKTQSVWHVSASDATFPKSRNMHVQSKSGKERRNW